MVRIYLPVRGVTSIYQPSFNPLLAQVWEFAEEGRLERVPVDDLVNYYEWLNNASIRNGFDEGTLDSATWMRPTDRRTEALLLSLTHPDL